MINGIKLKDSTLSPNQRRIRLMELGGIPISDRDKKKLQPRMGLLTKSKQEESEEDLEFNLDEFIDELEQEITLDEILQEMGYYDEEDEDELEETLSPLLFASSSKQTTSWLSKNECEYWRAYGNDEATWNEDDGFDEYPEESF